VFFLANSFTNIEENRFWLQVFGDKTSILAHRFAPEYKMEIEHLKQYSEKFYDLAKQAREDPSEDQKNQLNIDALQATGDLKQFITVILRKQLISNLYISILPADINTIINLCKMYLYILNEFVRNSKPNFDPTHFLGFWLPIVTPQAVFIENNVGLYFSEYKDKVHNYSSIFMNDEKRIQENISIIQNGITDFPLIHEVISSINEHLYSFETFIVDTIILVEQKKLPSSITPIYLDHLYRVVCYVATQLSLMQGIKRPACDPGGYPALAQRYTII
jgi:hypothetical protein